MSTWRSCEGGVQRRCSVSFQLGTCCRARRKKEAWDVNESTAMPYTQRCLVLPSHCSMPPNEASALLLPACMQGHTPARVRLVTAWDARWSCAASAASAAAAAWRSSSRIHYARSASLFCRVFRSASSDFFRRCSDASRAAMDSLSIAYSCRASSSSSTSSISSAGSDTAAATR